MIYLAIDPEGLSATGETLDEAAESYMRYHDQYAVENLDFYKAEAIEVRVSTKTTLVEAN